MHRQPQPSMPPFRPLCIENTARVFFVVVVVVLFFNVMLRMLEELTTLMYIIYVTMTSLCARVEAGEIALDLDVSRHCTMIYVTRESP